MEEKIDFNFKGADFSDVELEQTEVMEYEVSDDISILYDKSTKRFLIEGFDQDTFDEYVIGVEEPFEDMEIDGITISKQDFEEFKELVLKST